MLILIRTFLRKPPLNKSGYHWNNFSLMKNLFQIKSNAIYAFSFVLCVVEKIMISNTFSLNSQLDFLFWLIMNMEIHRLLLTLSLDDPIEKYVYSLKASLNFFSSKIELIPVSFHSLFSVQLTNFDGFVLFYDRDRKAAVNTMT